MMADNDRTWAEAAFREFYDRHKYYLWNACEKVCGNMGCQPWAEDALAETFERAFKAAAKFKPVPCPREDEDHIVKGWLGTIATNWVCDRRRKSKLEDTYCEELWAKLADPAQTDPGDTQAPSGEPSPTALEERRLLDEAMESLTEREAHILRVTGQYHRIGQPFQRLPEDVVEELAETFNTTPENLRKIRERARKKVRQYMDAHRGSIFP